MVQVGVAYFNLRKVENWNRFGARGRTNLSSSTRTWGLGISKYTGSNGESKGDWALGLGSCWIYTKAMDCHKGQGRSWVEF